MYYLCYEFVAGRCECIRMRFMYNDYLQRPDAASSPSKVLALDEAAEAFHRLP